MDFLKGKEGAKTAVDYSNSNTADLIAARAKNNRISTSMTPTAFQSTRKQSMTSKMTKNSELRSRRSHKRKKAESLMSKKREKED